MRTIILASSSPRRKEILEKMHLPFTIEPSKYHERIAPNTEPQMAIQQLSLAKAQTVAVNHTDAIVIGADTFVVVENEIMGKPKNAIEAKEMLEKLSGKMHTVLTGLTLIDTKTKKMVTDVAEANVYFRTLTETEIDWYIATKEPLDKAGAYAIQESGGLFVEKIEGNFFAIVGLPLTLLVKRLKEFGISVF